MVSTGSSGGRSEDLLVLAAIAVTHNGPVLGKTLDGTIHCWNAGAERPYGYRAEEIVGNPVRILAPSERVGEIEEILAGVRRGEVITLEMARRRRDGTESRSRS